MTNEAVYSLLIDKRVAELNGKSVEKTLTRAEQAELRALEDHQGKAPAVTHRIRILAARMAHPNRWGSLMMRFSRKCRQNMAELEALSQYGHSRTVWEIAYLYRKQAVEKLNPMEQSELYYLTLYHDSPEVLRITHLKMKEEFGYLNAEETRELAELQRNLYREEGIPDQLLELFWPSQQQGSLDASRLR